MKNYHLVFLLALIAFTSCFHKKKKFNNLAILYKNNIYQETEVDTQYLITEVEVDGVKVGDSYKTHKRKLKKISQEEQYKFYRDFDLYNKKKEKIGYVYLDPFDKKSIKTIEIISPKYTTDKGIGVGSTFYEVREKYPTSETHGSEIEGRTTVMVGDFHFLLENVFFNSYNVNESKIHPSTPIKMITLRK